MLGTKENYLKTCSFPQNVCPEQLPQRCQPWQSEARSNGSLLSTDLVKNLKKDSGKIYENYVDILKVHGVWIDPIL